MSVEGGEGCCHSYRSSAVGLALSILIELPLLVCPLLLVDRLLLVCLPFPSRFSPSSSYLVARLRPHCSYVSSPFLLVFSCLIVSYGFSLFLWFLLVFSFLVVLFCVVSKGMEWLRDDCSRGGTLWWHRPERGRWNVTCSLCQRRVGLEMARTYPLHRYKAGLKVQERSQRERGYISIPGGPESPHHLISFLHIYIHIHIYLFIYTLLFPLH